MASLSEHEERIREARLLVSSPEVVCAELKRYGEEAVDGFGIGDKELERNLLARGDQLIDLALAEYGTDRDIAVICALIAGGAAQQYVERQFHKADP